MQPMNTLELKYYLKDLERRAKRDVAFVSEPRSCALCAALRDALGRTVRFMRKPRQVRSLHPAEGR
jgi:hypothetical protein